MRVFVNDSEISVSLQNERTAGEVVRGLHTWLHSEGFGISSIRLNGADLATGGVWQETEVDRIEEIRILSQASGQLRLASLTQILAWTDALDDVVRDFTPTEGSISRVLSLFSRYPDLEPAFNFLCEFDPSPSKFIEREHRHTLEYHIGCCTDERQNFVASAVEPLQHSLQALGMIGRDRLKELADPRREAQSTAQVLQGFLSELAGVGILLQTYREKEAFAKILAFSEVLSKMIRLLWLLTEAATSGEGPAVAEVAAWNQEAEACLTQILEAMHAADSVMIGDLLEYELPPIIERLTALVPAGGS